MSAAACNECVPQACRLELERAIPREPGAAGAELRHQVQSCCNLFPRNAFEISRPVAPQNEMDG
eukprot:12249246-Karenia_brevis.AAC.1